MKRRDEVKKEFVRQWLAKAEGDLRASRHLLDGGPGFAAAAAFHAQQAAEKSLKSVLVWHQVEFTKTRDIGAILELLARVEGELVGRLADANVLTPYAARYRYPGEVPEPTISEAGHAADIAETVFREVVLRLASELHPVRTEE